MTLLYSYVLILSTILHFSVRKYLSISKSLMTLITEALTIHLQLELRNWDFL